MDDAGAMLEILAVVKSVAIADGRWGPDGEPWVGGGRNEGWILRLLVDVDGPGGGGGNEGALPLGG